jgi:hypothetical protein
MCPIEKASAITVRPIEKATPRIPAAPAGAPKE